MVDIRRFARKLPRILRGLQSNMVIFKPKDGQEMGKLAAHRLFERVLPTIVISAQRKTHGIIVTFDPRVSQRNTQGNARAFENMPLRRVPMIMTVVLRQPSQSLSRLCLRRPSAHILN